MLRRKMMRDIRKNISQYITIFLMVLIGVMAYTGIKAYMAGMISSANTYYEDYKLQDLDAYGIYDKDDIKEAKKIKNVNDVSGILTLPNLANINNHTKDVARISFIEENKINKFYIKDGIEFDYDKDGVWVDYMYAEKEKIKVGDKLEFTYENIDFTKKVLGLIGVPDKVYDVKDESVIFPTHDDYGYMYISISYIPEKYIKNMVMKEASISSEKEFDLAYKYKEGKEFDYKDYIFYTTLLVDVDNEENKKDVKKELLKLENTSVVFDIKDELSYSGYQREADEGKTYVGIFSGLFIFIAVLSVITTMTRVVKKERTEIGTLKALGFSNFKVSLHYISYGVFLSIFASILGILVGYYGLGKFVMSMEMTYYEVPYYDAFVEPNTYIVASLVVLLVIITTYLSTHKILKLNAADTLRAERPKGAGRSLNITKNGIFKHLSFSSKWNIRDIIRNKARSFMGLIGIIGTMILLVCSLGMYNTIQNYLKVEFEDLSNYENRINLAKNITDEELKNLTNKYGDNTSETLMVEVEMKDKTESNNIFVDNSNNYVRFVDSKSNFMKLKSNGVYITRKFASLNNIKVGDKIKFNIVGDKEKYECVVIGFNKDPQNQNITMTKEYLEQELKLEYKPQAIYTNEDIEKDTKLKGVSSIQNISDIVEGANMMIETMMSIIVILIVFACILGAVIIYNMGILSFTEKNYQFATLKVLGFDNKKISKIFIEQNIWIGILAIILGMPLGYMVTDVIFKNAIGDVYDFDTYIKPISYIVSGIGTFIVTYLVSLWLSRKINKIDMVTSLKGNE